MIQSWRSVYALTVVILAAVLWLYSFNTTPTSEGDGFGADGVHYRAIVIALRTGEETLPWQAYAYRILTPAVVAASGLEPRLGFLLVDVVATAGSAFLLLRLLRRFGTTPAQGVVALLWWSALPFALRYHLHYAALVDALAMFLVVAVMVAAIERRVVLFAVLLALGVLARENVLVLAPLLALNPPFTLRSFATASAAATPALGALFWVHAFPPVSADPGSASTLEWVQAHLTAVATNADDTALRALAAFPLSCGLLLAPIIAAPRAALRLVARQPGWTYLVVILSLIAIIGGRDNDRYLLTISPIVVVVAFAMMRALWRRPLVVAMLTGAHLVATRAFVPLADMPIFTAGWMPHDELVSAATASAVLCVIGALVCRIASGWSRFALVDRAPFTSLGRTLATEAARNVIRGQV